MVRIQIDRLDGRCRCCHGAPARTEHDLNHRPLLATLCCVGVGRQLEILLLRRRNRIFVEPDRDAVLVTVQSDCAIGRRELLAFHQSCGGASVGRLTRNLGVGRTARGSSSCGHRLAELPAGCQSAGLRQL